VRGTLYNSCVRSNTLQESETWPIRKESDVALQQAEMRIVGWMYDIKRLQCFDAIGWAVGRASSL